MRKITLSIVVALAALIIAGYPCAAEKITTDPNAFGGGAVAQAVTDPQSDTRLAQKITYEAAHRPLKLILSDLSTMTGVELNAGLSKTDWQVRDRKMNIFVKDVRLAALMSSIARAMKLPEHSGALRQRPLLQLGEARRSDRNAQPRLVPQASRADSGRMA